MTTQAAPALLAELPGARPASWRLADMQNTMKLGRRTELLTLAGFAFCLIVMSALSALAFHQARNFTRSAAGIVHNQEVLRILEQLRATLAGAETGHRGYLITGDTVYLEPYQQALSGISADLDRLAQSVRDDPQQSRLAAQAASNVDARFQTFERVIAAYRTQGFKAAQALIATDTGRVQTERIHSAINDMNVLAQDRLLTHQLQQQNAEARLRYSILALAVMMLAVLSLIYMLVRRSAAAGRQAEQLLGRLNVTLETRVTERTVQLEQRTHELEQRTQQLEQANRQLESFSYSVSHDLRAPLRAVSGFAQILARRHRDAMNDEARHFMDNIVQASAHMGRLIDDLLNYSRLGRTAVALRPVSLTQVLDNTRRTLQPRVAETGAMLNIAPDLPVVSGDQTLLGQIFSNLIENALIYRKPGVPARVSLTWQRSNGHVVVSVADNGIGIAAESLEKIFQVFQRLHSQDEYPGTGIGLAVVHKAVEMQGGKVWVESTVGAGSTFHVQLPAAQGK